MPSGDIYRLQVEFKAELEKLRTLVHGWLAAHDVNTLVSSMQGLETATKEVLTRLERRIMALENANGSKKDQRDKN